MAKDKNMSSGNLYDFLDEMSAKEAETEIHEKQVEHKKSAILNFIVDYGKLFLVFSIIIVGFLYKHSDTTFQQDEIAIKSYFNDFTKTEKQLSKEDKIRNKNDAKILSIPNIKIEGILNKDDGKYVVFKYKNKIYTKKEKDSFAEGEFVIEKIYMTSVDIRDSKGNIHSIEIQ